MKDILNDDLAWCIATLAIIAATKNTKAGRNTVIDVDAGIDAAKKFLVEYKKAHSFKTDAISFAEWKEVFFRTSYAVDGKHYRLLEPRFYYDIKGVVIDRRYSIEELYDLFSSQ